MPFLKASLLQQMIQISDLQNTAAVSQLLHCVQSDPWMGNFSANLTNRNGHSSTLAMPYFPQ